MTVEPPVQSPVQEQVQEPEPVGQDNSSSGGQDDVVGSTAGLNYLESDHLDTRSTSICSDSDEELPYDRPHVCVMDLGAGEFADGYRERLWEAPPSL